MDKTLQAELQAAYEPAISLAQSFGCLTAEFYFGCDSEQVADSYACFAETFAVADKFATKSVLDALDDANDLPVVAGDHAGRSGFELTLLGSYRELRDLVVGVLGSACPVPTSYERGVDWPEVSADQVEQRREVLGRFLTEEKAFSKDKGVLIMFVYKEFKRVLRQRLPVPDARPTIRVRTTKTDDKILAVIDKYGSVKSQTDLLNKIAAAGEVMDIGTAKPRLAELKANGTLVAVKGNEGYQRPVGT